MSLIGAVAKKLLRKKVCLNPEIVPNGAARLSGLAEKTSKRALSKKLLKQECVTESGVKYERITVKGAQKTDKAVYYVHGGAFVASLHPFYRNLALSLSKAAGGAEVIFLDYKTAPEYKYPTQLDEALDVWTEITGKLGYKAENVIIGGDSAGGNLALALMLKVRDSDEPLPRAGFFISPWADMTASGSSYIDNYRIDPLFGNIRKPKNEINGDLRVKLISSGIFSYASSLTEIERKHPLVSPTFGEYRGFPPCFFTVGGEEMLLSDPLTIVEKMKSAGVTAELDVTDGMFHIFALFKDKIPEARRSYGKLLSFIKRQTD